MQPRVIARRRGCVSSPGGSGVEDVVKELLQQVRGEVVKGWLEAALAVFPAESAKFFGKAGDPFANPIGNTLSEEIAFLFDAVVRDAPEEEIAPHLERVVQITCVQEVAPSRSIAFVFELRTVLRRALASALPDQGVAAELQDFEARIDRLALQAFDCYAGLRQRIADIRVREIQGRVTTLVKMAGVGWDDLPRHEESQGGCAR